MVGLLYKVGNFELVLTVMQRCVLMWHVFVVDILFADVCCDVFVDVCCGYYCLVCCSDVFWFCRVLLVCGLC